MFALLFRHSLHLCTVSRDTAFQSVNCTAEDEVSVLILCIKLHLSVDQNLMSSKASSKFQGLEVVQERGN